MILSIHSSAAFQIANGWPKVWPPVQLPPPSPLSAAATLLWGPRQSGNPNGATTTAADTTLYSTQLNQGAQPGPSGDTSAGFQMAFIDQRIALMRYDTSHGPDTPKAPPEDNVAA